MLEALKNPKSKEQILKEKENKTSNSDGEEDSKNENCKDEEEECPPFVHPYETEHGLDNRDVIK